MLKLLIITFLIAVSTNSIAMTCGQFLSPLSKSLIDRTRYIVHLHDGSAFAAELRNRVLTVSTNMPSTLSESDHLGEGYSKEDLYDKTIAHFGLENIQAIRGQWHISSESPSANLKDFDEALERGLEEEAAALKTWEGKMASQYGFGQARMLKPDLVDGRISTINVEFLVPDGTVLFSNSEEYVVHLNDGFIFHASLEEGELMVTAFLEIFDGNLISPISAVELYPKMIQHFGTENIKVITEIWTNDTDPFNQFVKGSMGGKTDEVAALATVAGKAARLAGFGEVASISKKIRRGEDESSDSYYFIVKFIKPGEDLDPKYLEDPPDDGGDPFDADDDW